MTAFRRLTLACLVLAASLAGCRSDDATGARTADQRLARALGLPTDYRARYTRYAEVYCLSLGRMRRLWANDAALAAARDGRPLPAGAQLVAEMYTMETSPQGELRPGTLHHISVMRRTHFDGQVTTLGDWDFSGMNVDGTRINPSNCRGCHENAEARGYVFTGADLYYMSHQSAPAAEPPQYPSIERTTECR